MQSAISQSFLHGWNYKKFQKSFLFESFNRGAYCVCIVVTVYILTGSNSIEMMFYKIWTLFGSKAGDQVKLRIHGTKMYENGSYSGEFLNGMWVY